MEAIMKFSKACVSVIALGVIIAGPAFGQAMSRPVPGSPLARLDTKSFHLAQVGVQCNPGYKYCTPGTAVGTGLCCKQSETCAQDNGPAKSAYCR